MPLYDGLTMFSVWALWVLTLAAADAPLDRIRAGDLEGLRRSLAAGADAKAADERGVTALMYAARYGGIEAMRLLLAHGADVNATSEAGGTALMAAAGELDKAKLLLEHGADVAAVAKAGSVLALAAWLGNGLAELLLDRGAKPDRQAIHGAIAQDNLPLLRRMVAAGFDPKGMPLLNRAGAASPELMSYLIEAGAIAGEPDTQSRQTPLMTAAYFGLAANVRLLLDAGQRVDAADNRGRTALAFAAGSDDPNPEVVRLLLEAGANREVKDVRGDTALDWARKGRNDARLIALLGGKAEAAAPAAADAGTSRPVRQALGLAMEKLDAAGPVFFQANGCISCHNQSIPEMAAAALRERGVALPAGSGTHARFVLSIFGAERHPMWQSRCTAGGGGVATLTYGLVGLAAEKHPSNEIIEGAAHCLAILQRSDGSWYTRDSRAPLGMGEAKWTALSIRALDHYAMPGVREAYRQRIARARGYLLAGRWDDTQSSAFQVLGLLWAKAPADAVRKAAQRLEARQMGDGGYAQRPGMASDAYATAQAAWALAEAGKPWRRAYERAALWLRRAQKPDGTWHVRSRGFGFQPYRETGFPHGHDQWISSAATGFAVLALAPLVDLPVGK